MAHIPARCSGVLAAQMSVLSLMTSGTMAFNLLIPDGSIHVCKNQAEVKRESTLNVSCSSVPHHRALCHSRLTAPPSRLSANIGDWLGQMLEGMAPQEFASSSKKDTKAEPILAGIYRYLVKSCRGESLTHAEVNGEGVVGDRRYMFNSFGGFVTQRQQPALATINATLEPGGALRLSGSGVGALSVPVLQDTPEQVWFNQVTAYDQGNEVASWASNLLGAVVRLRWGLRVTLLEDMSPRHQSPRSRNDPGTGLGMDAVAMDRFRPNLVVRNCGQAYVEDRWGKVAIGAAVFQTRSPCPRCTVPDVDQQTGRYSPRNGPMQTLRSYRKQGGSINFGTYLWPVTMGIVRLGDAVRVLDQKGPPPFGFLQ